MKRIFLVYFCILFGSILVVSYPLGSFESDQNPSVENLDSVEGIKSEKESSDALKFVGDVNSDDLNIDIYSEPSQSEFPLDEYGRPMYGKGKLNQLYEYLFGWSPKKFYNDKVKSSKLYKILFD
ncbi:unnamed protein product [Brachionus calyciflorus]|uniref:Uncharacterized protein n=1 Tax=Brachionus calyciflorus TaxID=104777 RepID=A0A814DEY2_9BILA|nr:unnamed protein product [Brachionus calyciflorus]